MEEVQTINIGARLKARRLELGYSLKDAAESTCIRKVYLESLEVNQFEVLPGKVYVLGFLKTYARYLELDPKPLLIELNSLNNEVPATSVKKADTHKKEFTSEGWGVFFVGLLAVLLTGAAIYFLPSLFQADPAEIASPAPVVAEEKNDPDQDSQSSTVEPLTEVNQDAVSPVEAEAEMPLQSLPFIPPDGTSLRMLALTESSLIIHLDERKPQSYRLNPDLDLTWIVKQKVRVELAAPDVARFWLGKEELSLKNRTEFQLHQSP